ncbi:MAG: GGDEF domain-containing protein [Deltaproteobacteria bacterium]|nr:GGDEF domain-containing protein [Deltaproteobacteria bacterium]MDZ4341489.1 GGDEF domain-containing protein [Candidatus Binatia bacterium]
MISNAEKTKQFKKLLIAMFANENFLHWFPNKPSLNAPDKDTVIRLRWIVILASCCLLAFARQTIVAQNIVYLFGSIHVFSNLVLHWLNAKRFAAFRLFAILVIFDTTALSASLILTGQLGSDLYLTYFLVIIVAGFWRDLRWSLAFSFLISSLYTFLLFIADDVSTYTFLRIPFLFVVSVFYGYCTQLVTTERQLREKAEKDALTDFLTDLPNRKAFENKVTAEVARAVRYNRPLSLLILDIDNFKSINDTLGHQWGDVVLHGIAAGLKVSVRPHDFVARVGGEEFAVVVPETDLAGAVQLGNRLRLQIKEQPFQTPKGLLVVTVSIGASSNSVCNSSDWRELYSDADEALYCAKQNGKDQVEISPTGSLNPGDFGEVHH